MGNQLWGEAATFLQQEKMKIDDATVLVREDRRKARRNYEQKYDNPIDKSTGAKKIFVPLTTENVDAIAPRMEVDPEAISITSNEPGNRRKAIIWEELVIQQLKNMGFEEKLKGKMTSFVNEGNVVVEVFWDPELKGPNVRTHDVKDVFLFPKELSFAQSSGFAVKHRMLMSHFKEDKLYDKEQKQLVFGSVVERDDFNRPGSQKEEVGVDEIRHELEWVEIYERQGWYPKHLLTGDDRDRDTLVEGTIACAWIDRAPIVVAINEKSRRTAFIEAWYNRRDYSWYGNGIGVLLRDYQKYLNKIVNRRSNNEDILHHGMFKKRRGVNIDARQRTSQAGVFIEVDDMKGLEQMNTYDITGPSYKGEDNIIENVQRITGVTDLARGLGSARSASEVAIKDRNMGTRFQPQQQSLNRLMRLVVEEIMRLDREHLTGDGKDVVVKLTGRDETLALFDDFKLKTVNKVREEEGLAPISGAEFEQAMKEFGGDRFMKLPSMKFLKGEFTVDIDIDSSLIKSKAGQADFIINAMQIAGQIPGVPETLDFADMFEKFMDLNGMKVKRRESVGVESAVPAGGPPPSVSPLPEAAIDNVLRSEGARRAEQPIVA